MRDEHITIDRLHSEMNLVSLEQRRNIQLLTLKFYRSKNEAYIKKPVRILRGNRKIQFKLMTRCTGKYLNSPLYRGSTLWDTLPEEIQHAVSTKVFTQNVCNLNRTYVDLLSKNVTVL